MSDPVLAPRSASLCFFAAHRGSVVVQDARRRAVARGARAAHRRRHLRRAILALRSQRPIAIGVILTLAALYVRLTGRESEPRTA